MARPRLAAGRFAPVLLAALLGCAGLVGLEPLAPDPRMLRATIGPGADRLSHEAMRDEAVFELVVAQGRPDYVWAPVPDVLVLLYLAADRAVRFGGPSGARVLLGMREPIPDAWLELVAAEDREEVRARRIDLVARVQAARPGWCEVVPDAPPPTPVCLHEPAVEALLAEIRRKTLASWQIGPPEHGGERVILRFRVAASGELVEGCTLGATSPLAARTALEALETALPVPALGPGSACLAGAPVVWRFEIATD